MTKDDLIVKIADMRTKTSTGHIGLTMAQEIINLCGEYFADAVYDVKKFRSCPCGIESKKAIKKAAEEK